MPRQPRCAGSSSRGRPRPQPKTLRRHLPRGQVQPEGQTRSGRSSAGLLHGRSAARAEPRARARWRKRKEGSSREKNPRLGRKPPFKLQLGALATRARPHTGPLTAPPPQLTLPVPREKSPGVQISTQRTKGYRKRASRRRAGVRAGRRERTTGLTRSRRCTPRC